MSATKRFITPELLERFLYNLKLLFATKSEFTFNRVTLDGSTLQGSTLVYTGTFLNLTPFVRLTGSDDATEATDGQIALYNKISKLEVTSTSATFHFSETPAASEFPLYVEIQGAVV